VSPTPCVTDNSGRSSRCRIASPWRSRRSVQWLLLTGDGRLRKVAGAEEVECHGVLWLIDIMEAVGTPSIQLLHDGLTTLAAHPRCRLPPNEITIRLERYRVVLEAAPDTEP